MAGYQEVLTDPSYAGQIVAMTSPHQGNYGMNAADPESARGAGRGVRGARGGAARVVVALRGDPGRRRSPDRASRASKASTRGGSRDACAMRGSMRAAISTVDLDPASLAERVRGRPGHGRRRPRTDGVGRRALRGGGARRDPPTPTEAGCSGSRPTTSGSSARSCGGSRPSGIETTVFPAQTPAGGGRGRRLRRGVPVQRARRPVGHRPTASRRRVRCSARCRLRHLPRATSCSPSRSAAAPSRCRSATGA